MIFIRSSDTKNYSSSQLQFLSSLIISPLPTTSISLTFTLSPFFFQHLSLIIYPLILLSYSDSLTSHHRSPFLFISSFPCFWASYWPWLLILPHSSTLTRSSPHPFPLPSYPMLNIFLTSSKTLSHLNISPQQVWMFLYL